MVYECEGCGFQEERKIGDAYLIERACPNFPECCIRCAPGTKHAGEPLGASTMRVAGMNCWNHGWNHSPHQTGRGQLTIYDRA